MICTSNFVSADAIGHKINKVKTDPVDFSGVYSGLSFSKENRKPHLFKYFIYTSKFAYNSEGRRPYVIGKIEEYDNRKGKGEPKLYYFTTRHAQQRANKIELQLNLYSKQSNGNLIKVGENWQPLIIKTNDNKITINLSGYYGDEFTKIANKEEAYKSYEEISNNYLRSKVSNNYLTIFEGVRSKYNGYNIDIPIDKNSDLFSKNHITAVYYYNKKSTSSQTSTNEENYDYDSLRRSLEKSFNEYGYDILNMLPNLNSISLTTVEGKSEDFFVQLHRDEFGRINSWVNLSGKAKEIEDNKLKEQREETRKRIAELERLKKLSPYEKMEEKLSEFENANKILPGKKAFKDKAYWSNLWIAIKNDPEIMSFNEAFMSSELGKILGRGYGYEYNARKQDELKFGTYALFVTYLNGRIDKNKMGISNYNEFTRACFLDFVLTYCRECKKELPKNSKTYEFVISNTVNTTHYYGYYNAGTTSKTYNRNYDVTMHPKYQEIYEMYLYKGGASSTKNLTSYGRKQDLGINGEFSFSVVPLSIETIIKNEGCKSATIENIGEILSELALENRN